MPKRFYSEYVRHALRFYWSSPTTLKGEAEKRNWQSVHNTLKAYSREEIDIFRRVYLDKEALPSAVISASESSGIQQKEIYDRLKRLEKQIAKERGLI